MGSAVQRQLKEDDVPDYIRVGVVPEGAEPVDLPDPDRLCGHCGDMVLAAPDPPAWIPGWLEPGERVRVCVTQRCYGCELPSIVTWIALPGDDRTAQLTDNRQAPPPPPQPLNIPEYEGTVIQAYHQEAWRCRKAGLRRAAMVIARATLQACFRRYLHTSERGSYSSEMELVAERAGQGWRAVGLGVRAFGNKWAHPEGPVDPPSWPEVAEAFRRMQAVLTFTAEMERVGHLQLSRDSHGD